jgi:hypothetical protein
VTPTRDDPASGSVGIGQETASRYEVLAKIASGGMATVYVGRVRGAVGFSRLVAIKRPHPFVSDDPALREGLGHEARVASMIHHPHVVSVVDVEVQGDRVALILDYVEGGTLADLSTHAERAKIPLDPRVVLRIILDVASGLHAAHVLRDPKGAPLGIVHRDVSPQNILVGLDGQARLTDFGIAKVTTELESTATDVLKGKLGYLPPEYIEKRAFEVRSDEYALAVVTWEALAGRRLFKGHSDVDTIQRIMGGKAPRISEVWPQLAPLDGVLARALSSDLAERFDSVASFAEALEQKAREGAWVASYGDVAAMVEAAVGGRVREKRAAVESSAPRILSEVLEASRQPLPPSARDALPTLSLMNAAPDAPALREPPGPPPRSLVRRAALVSLFVALGIVVALGIHRPASEVTSHAEDPLPSPLGSAGSAGSAETRASAPTVPEALAPPGPAPLPAAPPTMAASGLPRSAPRQIRRPPVSPTVEGRGSLPSPSPSHPRAPPNPYAP